MVYGQIAESTKINALIYRCFDELPETEQRKFVKKFRDQPHDQDQVMHTLAELVCGAYLQSKGYRMVHDHIVKGKTPDWCILGANNSVQAIIEVANFHIDQTTDRYIKEQKKSKRIVFFWRDGNADNEARLYQCIQDKAMIYKELVNSLALPYVIALRPDFRAGLDFEDEVRGCLYLKKDGVFDLFPHVSGVLYFEEINGRYTFRYASNPNCPRIMNLPGGDYP